MAWTPVVVKNEKTGLATVYIRDGERQEVIDIVEADDQDHLEWAEERAWIRADVMNEQDQ